VTALFANNSMVSFGDVNLAEDSIGGPYQAGAGGWPTVRYFNTDTGAEGKPYVKKTGGAMCEELGQDKYMNDYVLEAGSTSLCNAATGEACTDKEKDFVLKWNGKSVDEVAAQVTRLRGMAASSMKPELKEWLGQRLNALTQLQVAALAPKEEL